MHECSAMVRRGACELPINNLPDVLRQPIFDKVLIFMLVLANIYQVVVFAWSVTDGMKVQDHSPHTSRPGYTSTNTSNIGGSLEGQSRRPDVVGADCFASYTCMSQVLERHSHAGNVHLAA